MNRARGGGRTEEVGASLGCELWIRIDERTWGAGEDWANRSRALLDRYLAAPELGVGTLQAGFTLSPPELGLGEGPLDAFWMAATWLEAFVLLGTGVASARCTPWEEGVVELTVTRDDVRLEHRHVSGKVLGALEVSTFEVGSAFLAPVKTFGMLMAGLSSEAGRRAELVQGTLSAKLDLVRESAELRPGLVEGAVRTLERWTAH